MLQSAYSKAIEVLEKCKTTHGFFASAGKDGYNAIWARDSIITSLGASLVNQQFKNTFKASLITLAKNQSPNGQIPNAVDKFSKRKPHTDYQTIDSSLWYIIGHFIYKQRYKDSSLFNRNKASIIKALNWLKCQDPGEKGMLAQLPTSDWQDAFPHKYGHTINTQSLYYKVLTLFNKDKEAEKLKNNTNNNQDSKLWNNNYYLPYRWKNHNQYQEKGEWFDSLGNLLAIVFNLTDKNQAEKILKHIKQKRINLPYPVKTIHPPITRSSKHWQDYFLDCDARNPNSYSNGGIWGFNGAFYILSLIKQKKFNQAQTELNKLAELNLKANFPEWTHPLTKKSYGKLQAWEAGTYILAYKSLRAKRVLL